MKELNFSEYQDAARRTQRKDLPLWATREHALYGLSSEVGEVLGLHQKVHQGHPLDENALRLEIGDCLWFIAELCDVYGFDLGEVAEANIAKLRNRYPVEFEADLSINRPEYRRRTRARHYSASLKKAIKDGRVEFVEDV